MIVTNFIKENFDVEIKVKWLVNKSGISNLVITSPLNTKLSKLATKAELKAEQDIIVKLKAFIVSHLHGKSRFGGDGTYNYLVIRLVSRYFKKLLIAVIFQRGSQKDSLMKVLNLYKFTHKKVVNTYIDDEINL